MTSFTGECTEPDKPSASFSPSLATTQAGLVQQTPALALWKYDVRSKNRPCKLCKLSLKKWSTCSRSSMNNINLLITFVHRRYAVVSIRSLSSQTMRIIRACSRAYLLRHFLDAQCAHQFHPSA